MPLSGELTTLWLLRLTGGLTDGQFTQAKRRVLLRTAGGGIGRVRKGAQQMTVYGGDDDALVSCVEYPDSAEGGD
eukprot:gene44193-49351_t